MGGGMPGPGEKSGAPYLDSEMWASGASPTAPAHLKSAATPVSGAQLKPAAKASEADIFSLNDMVARFDVKTSASAAPSSTSRNCGSTASTPRSLAEKFYAALRDTILQRQLPQPDRRARANPHRNPGRVRQPNPLLLRRRHSSHAEKSSYPRSAPSKRRSPSPPNNSLFSKPTDWTHDGPRTGPQKTGRSTSVVGQGELHAPPSHHHRQHDVPPLLESMVVFGKARSLDRVRRFLDTQKKLRRNKEVAYRGLKRRGYPAGRPSTSFRPKARTCAQGASTDSSQ